jgi:hypothetical protein
MIDAVVIFITAIDAEDDYDIATLKLLNGSSEILVVSVRRNDFEHTTPDPHVDEFTGIAEGVETIAELLASGEIIEDFQI